MFTKITFINIDGENCHHQFPKHGIQVSDVFFIGNLIQSDIIHVVENISCRIQSKNKLQNPYKTGQEITKTKWNPCELVCEMLSVFAKILLMEFAEKRC